LFDVSLAVELVPVQGELHRLLVDSRVGVQRLVRDRFQGLPRLLRCFLQPLSLLFRQCVSALRRQPPRDGQDLFVRVWGEGGGRGKRKEQNGAEDSDQTKHGGGLLWISGGRKKGRGLRQPPRP